MTSAAQHARFENAFAAMLARRRAMQPQEAHLDSACVLARVVGVLQGWTLTEPLPDRLVELVAEAMERGG